MSEEQLISSSSSWPTKRSLYRNERPLLEQAFKGLGGRYDDRIGNEDLSYLIMSRMLADVQERTEMAIARASQAERDQLLHRN